MLILQSIIISIIFIFLYQSNNIIHPLYFAAFVSFSYYSYLIAHPIHAKTLSTLHILTQQLPHQIVYLLILYFVNHQNFMMIVPILINCIGKTYLIMKKFNQESKSIAQQLILFQVKCQAFILGTLFISSLTLNLQNIIIFVVYGVFVKTKHMFYFASQKSFVELHFAFDNLSRKAGCRPFYHLIYTILSVFSMVLTVRREVLY